MAGTAGVGEKKQAGNAMEKEASVIRDTDAPGITAIEASVGYMTT